MTQNIALSPILLLPLATTTATERKVPQSRVALLKLVVELAVYSPDRRPVIQIHDDARSIKISEDSTLAGTYHAGNAFKSQHNGTEITLKSKISALRLLTRIFAHNMGWDFVNQVLLVPRFVSIQTITFKSQQPTSNLHDEVRRFSAYAAAIHWGNEYRKPDCAYRHYRAGYYRVSRFWWRNVILKPQQDKVVLLWFWLPGVVDRATVTESLSSVSHLKTKTTRAQHTCVEGASQEPKLRAMTLRAFTSRGSTSGLRSEVPCLRNKVSITCLGAGLLNILGYPLNGTAFYEGKARVFAAYA
ncbi:hypothetical protein BC835DRAFT_1477877 [Cytidiella melzeri]|nr:hypothetical protein BC835DRAFT_1477877 [Cytidiella melzeri]